MENEWTDRGDIFDLSIKILAPYIYIEREMIYTLLFHNIFTTRQRGSNILLFFFLFSFTLLEMIYTLKSLKFQISHEDLSLSLKSLCPYRSEISPWSVVRSPALPSSVVRCFRSLSLSLSPVSDVAGFSLGGRRPPSSGVPTPVDLEAGSVSGDAHKKGSLSLWPDLLLQIKGVNFLSRRPPRPTDRHPSEQPPPSLSPCSCCKFSASLFS